MPLSRARTNQATLGSTIEPKAGEGEAGSRFRELHSKPFCQANHFAILSASFDRASRRAIRRCFRSTLSSSTRSSTRAQALRKRKNASNYLSCSQPDYNPANIERQQCARRQQQAKPPIWCILRAGECLSAKAICHTYKVVKQLPLTP
jgi:hypothetical protein